MPSEDKEADPGAKYLERDRITKCVTKMGMLFAGEEQLPVVSSTEVIIGEDLSECHSWKKGVVLLVTVGVVLLSCARAVFLIHTCVHVTREPAIAKQRSCMSSRTMQNDVLDHVNERTWILSWYSGDQLWQLMVLNTRSLCGKLVQFLRHVASTNENPTDVCPQSRVVVSFSIGLQVVMTICTKF